MGINECFAFFGGTMKKIIKYFTPFEYILWALSLGATIFSYSFFGGDVITLAASIIGITALLFCAKGHPAGQVLIIIFSFIYGYISYTFAYFGEMITYLGMSAPMAVWALVSWLKNPYQKGRAEVRVNSIKRREVILLGALTLVATAVFCPVLYHLNTNNLLFSTLSVSTSFLAVYLTARRSPYYALAYAANDIVLIVLWVLASLADSSYIGVVICFGAFLLNDIYGFISWRRMKRRQV